MPITTQTSFDPLARTASIAFRTNGSFITSFSYDGSVLAAPRVLGDARSETVLPLADFTSAVAEFARWGEACAERFGSVFQIVSSFRLETVSAPAQTRLEGTIGGVPFEFTFNHASQQMTSGARAAVNWSWAEFGLFVSALLQLLRDVRGEPRGRFWEA